MKQLIASLIDKQKITNTLVVVFILLFSSQLNAQGNLLVTPKRLVFDGAKKSEELNLANVGKDSATFAISYIQIKMKEDGTFEKITEPDSAQQFADKYLRYYPRTVTLAPNEAQTVKVQIIRTNELSPGEYRSHLYFRAVPVENPLGEKAVKNDTSISVQIVPIFGISIPTIIRVGESTSKVNLSNVSFNNDSVPLLKWKFNRSGNMSVYGDVTVNHVSPQGKITNVGVVRGVAVYSPTAIRNFKLPLAKTTGIDYNSGKLQVVYSDQTNKTKLAEAEIVLNKNLQQSFSKN